MSYILDALRRAEAERARGDVPGLHSQSVHAGMPAPAGPAQRPLAWGLGLAALLAVLLAGWAGWAWRATAVPPGSASASASSTPASSAVAAASAAPAAVAPAAAPPATPLASVDDAPPVPARGAVVPPSAARRDARRDAGRDADARAAARSTKPAVAASNAATEPRTDAAASRRAPSRMATDADAQATPAPARRVLSLAELPPDVRGSLPALSISGSIYSEDAASRFVMINGEAVREGGRINGELTLEQIQLKSAVLRFRGYRIRIPL